MRDSAKAISNQLDAIKHLAQKLKGQAIAAKAQISAAKWDNTMVDLIKMLEEAARDSGSIRVDLEKISKDLNQMKAGIEAMIANANVQYEA